MGVFFLGVAGFALFFLSDGNDTWWKKPAGKMLFPLAAVLLVIALVVQIHFSAPVIQWLPLRIACLILAAAFLWMEIDALFFALPRQASYGKPGEQRAVCAAGVYALCRHPGVLFFGFLMLFLWLAAGLNGWAAVIYTLLDVLLATFEDKIVFPRRIEGYCDYWSQAPFLIPTRRSFLRCINRRE
jgi:protein-S-isoprenylcysteine O-methyltransferase Ste14